MFTSLVLFGPRMVILLWWLIQPWRWNLAFDTFFWPFMGFLFLPWTTLMYVMVAPGGVTGFDWLWLGLMFIGDIGSYTGGAYGNRSHVPGYGRAP
jgi:hypothetical protein